MLFKSCKCHTQGHSTSTLSLFLMLMGGVLGVEREGEPEGPMRKGEEDEGKKSDTGRYR